MKKDFVVVGFVVHKNKTLLVRHKKLNMWLPPGGHIEKEEIPEETVKREIKEETGLDVEIIGKKDLKAEDKGVKILHTPRFIQLEDIDEFHQHIDLVYFCKADSDKIKLKKDEHHDIKWFSKSDLDDKKIAPNVAYIGKMAIDEVNR